MRRLKLLKSNLIMLTSFNELTLWYFISKLCNNRKEHGLICSFEILHFFSVEKGDEIWNGVYVEGSSCISSLLCIDSSENEIFVIIRFGIRLKCWLDSHAWRAGLRPEIDN